MTIVSGNQYAVTRDCSLHTLTIKYAVKRLRKRCVRVEWILIDKVTECVCRGYQAEF